MAIDSMLLCVLCCSEATIPAMTLIIGANLLKGLFEDSSDASCI